MDSAAAVFTALKEFGAPLAGLSEADFSEEEYFYQMGVPHTLSPIPLLPY